jgi:hypothetical protein
MQRKLICLLLGHRKKMTHEGDVWTLRCLRCHKELWRFNEAVQGLTTFMFKRD